ncbi:MULTISPECIES: LysR substrate-binding domain-containing protein [unclassified Pseudomonas]|uniref:LysR substrate-binding domain-containing protein n=1 Tax=unclassified Pseudomonas TaxID=196821 RepID=UPI001C80412D|nr:MULTISPECIES: LysR substrate-binding domain-containing protein [unclassified Pseudomonas]UYP32268.1 LysR substrate-binding domain-containing protein [Pseudomonas sp. Z8(2022)]GIZ12003.1 transcriptional regulator [Pseudomonas sp. NCCP-436]
MQDLNDLFYFAKVVEAGGFTAAGRLLGIPKSRLSRRIAELEHRLGARLLQRSTRKLALTDIGERYLRHCQAMLLEAEQAEETVANLTSEPRGRVRFSTPPGVTLLPDLISEFLKRYPRVQLEVLQTSRRVDLLNEAVDVALRVRNVNDEEPSLITRRLLPARAHIVAHPELISGLNLEQPEDLQQLPALGSIRADRRIHLRFCHATTQQVREIALEARLAVDDFPMRKAAALAGIGITLLPTTHCHEELADGRLIALLPQWTVPQGHIQLAYTHRRGMSPAVRAWIELLSDAFSRWSYPV